MANFLVRASIVALLAFTGNVTTSAQATAVERPAEGLRAGGGCWNKPIMPDWCEPGQGYGARVSPSEMKTVSRRAAAPRYVVCPRHQWCLVIQRFAAGLPPGDYIIDIGNGQTASWRSITYTAPPFVMWGSFEGRREFTEPMMNLVRYWEIWINPVNDVTASVSPVCSWPFPC
jgi:hypothetical protein